MIFSDIQFTFGLYLINAKVMVIVINSENGQANLLDVSKDEYIALLLTLKDRVNSMRSVVEASPAELAKMLKAPEGFDFTKFQKEGKIQFNLVVPMYEQMEAKRKELGEDEPKKP